MTLKQNSLFKKIPASYIYSTNGRDNILVRDVVSYLQYTYGLQITTSQVKDAIMKEGFSPKGHVSIRFKNDNSPMSTRSWSRINPRAIEVTVERQPIYTKEEIVKHHADGILNRISNIHINVDRDLFTRDGNYLLSESYIRTLIRSMYKNIRTKELSLLIQEIYKKSIHTKIQMFNDNVPSKSRYWKTYLFILNQKVDNPETDAVYIMYELITAGKHALPTYASLVKFIHEEKMHTITLRSQSLDLLKMRTERIAHVVNEVSKEANYKFKEGIYTSDRYTNSTKGGALEDDLFKNEINLFTL